MAPWALQGATGWRWHSPTPPDEFPWSTLATNVAGCFAIGVLMVLVVERLSSSRLVRPFFGTGLLGGFTTFSTYAVDTRELLAAGRPAVAAAYLLGTLVLGLLAVVVGTARHRAGAAMTLLLVLLGGAVGAPARYLADVAVQRLHRNAFPWGTWAVNVAGSFVLGVVARRRLHLGA